MGRRTSIARKQPSSMSAFDPAIQSKVNSLSHVFLDEAEKRLRQKIKAGDFSDLGFKDFMKEIRGMLRAIARPATTMQQINIPVTNQLPEPEDGKKPRIIEVSKEMDPTKLATLRKAQERHLENPNGPTEK